MALEYVAAYYSYLDLMEELSDAECGRLFKACLTYSKTGAVPELRGNERFVWPGIRSQIDRDAEKYRMRCEQNRNNRKQALTNDNDRQQPATKSTKTKAKAKEKTKEKAKASIEGVNPLTPLPGAGPDLTDAFSSWIAYKEERREGYKPTGLKSLTTQVQKTAAEYGEQAVADLIRECMAANWKGIIFDRLKNSRKRPEAQECRRTSWAELAAQMEAEGTQ